MPGHLFVYGTLHPDRAPRSIAAVARRLRSVGHATLRGRIYHLGDYPGLILDPAAEPVSGEIFAIPDAAALACLDDYEDFRPADPDNSLFLRVETTATLHDGSPFPCWVYVFNDSLP